MTLVNIIKVIQDKQSCLMGAASFNPFAAVYATVESSVIADFCEGREVKLVIEKNGTRFKINEKELEHNFTETSAEEMMMLIKAHFAWEGVLHSQVKVNKLSEDKYELLVSF